MKNPYVMLPNKHTLVRLDLFTATPSDLRFLVDVGRMAGGCFFLGGFAGRVRERRGFPWDA